MLRSGTMPPSIILVAKGNVEVRSKTKTIEIQENSFTI